LLYRLAYEYVKPEDFEKVLDVAKEYAKLTDYEVEALKELMKVITGIVAKENIIAILSILGNLKLSKVKSNLILRIPKEVSEALKATEQEKPFYREAVEMLIDRLGRYPSNREFLDAFSLDDVD